MAGAFSGVKILDFSQGVAGPMGCALLADFEADVVKVEPPGGDRIRDLPHYVVWNRNKRRLTLDLTEEADLAVAKDLIAKADIALFDHAPGRLEALGLDETSLRADHPELIHVWTPPYGTSGLWSQLPADHLLLSALTGAAFRQVSYADQPVHLVTPLGFYGQGVMTAAAMSTALYERAKSGAGQGVIVSGLNGLNLLSNPVTGAIRRRTGAGRPLGAGAGYRTYQCADGKYLFLGALFAHFFVKTLETMGFADAGSLPRGANTAMLLEMRFLEKPRDEWLELFLAHDVPAGPVITRKAWFESDIVANNKMRVQIEDRERGPVSMPGAPLDFSETPASIRHLLKPATLKDIAWSKPQKRARGPSAAPQDVAPLAGITVLDLGTVIAGAYATGILASLGANVIKIEPHEGDPFRGAGLGFASYSRGKRGLGLDLKLPEGRELFFDLVRHADVVLDNYRFGVRERLGIHYEALKGVNPRIISCTINAYGASGPYARTPGFDAVVQAHSGIMQAQGGEDNGEPVMMSITVNDVGSASISAFGVLAALYAREVTGVGQEVLTSLANTSCIMQSGEMTTYPGSPPNTPGGRDVLGSEALHRFYRCRDHWIAISAASEALFAALCAALEKSEWARTYKGNAVGADRDGALAQAIAEALAQMGAVDVLTKLLENGVPCAPVIRGEDAYDDPWLWENNCFEMYESPMHGEVVTGSPGFVQWTRSRSRCYERPVPEVGEHTIEVLREFGVPDQQIARLIGQRAVFSY